MPRAYLVSTAAGVIVLATSTCTLTPAYSASMDSSLRAQTQPASDSSKDQSQEALVFQKVLNAPSYKIGKDIVNETKALVAKKDYSGLNALAAKLRDSKAIYCNGFEHLDSFYAAFSIPFQQQLPVTTYQSQLDFCKDWINASPKSPTARVVLLKTQKEYAWQAKEEVGGVKPSREDMKVYVDRLHEAEKIYEEAKSLPDQCPQLYALELKVAKDLDYDLAGFDQVFNDGLKRFPDYFELYTLKMHYLMSANGAAKGDMENFVTTQADKIGGKDGDIFYGRMVWQAEIDNWDTLKLFEKTTFSWPRAKKGLESLLKETDDPLRVKGELVRLARSASDEETAKQYTDDILKK